MKTISQTYKTNIKELGKEIDSIITYSISNVDYELGNENLNSITLHYEGNILKSVMKQLDIESTTDIVIGTEINFQFGLKVDDDETVEDYRDNYEYIDYGNFIVYSSEKQEADDTYKIICYDKMLYAMKDYETPKVSGTAITYPITVRSYIDALCGHIDLTFANSSDTFVNYDKEIPSELFLDASGNSLDYTFRDVLDQLAQITASTICINDDDELEIRYINNTNDTINAEYLKDINVNFGEMTPPINTITFKRSADSDVISLSNPINLSDDLKNEIVISDNQFLNSNDRADYLSPILTQLYGLSYSLNDYTSTGITYYDLCDKYSVNIVKTDEAGTTIENNTYTCVMFNDEIQITQGLQENVHTDLAEQSKTDYNTTTKDDRGKNRTNLMVDKVNQKIEAEISSITEIKGIVIGNYELTNDIYYQANKNYYIYNNEQYVLYPAYQLYEGVREGDPSELNLFEEVITYSYDLTEDTTFDTSKTYYEYDDVQEEYVEYTGATTGNPHELGLYERQSNITSYQLTNDTSFQTGKNYYIRHYDIGDNIPSNTIYELLGSKIQEMNDSLQSQINNTNESINTLSRETTSKFTETNTGFSAEISKVYKKINDNQDINDGKFIDITNYLRYENGIVSLGITNNPLILKLRNDRIYFEQNGMEVAYISNNILYITDGNFLRQLQIGHFAFIPRTDSQGNFTSLSFRKVG